MTPSSPILHQQSILPYLDFIVRKVAGAVVDRRHRLAEVDGVGVLLEVDDGTDLVVVLNLRK